MSVRRLSRVLTLAIALSVAVFVVFIESRRFLAEAAPAPNIDTSPKVQSSEAFGMAGGCVKGGVFIPEGGACNDPTQLAQVCMYSQEICTIDANGVGACVAGERKKDAGTICRQGSGCQPHSLCNADGWCQDYPAVVCPADTECRKYGCSAIPGGPCVVVFEQAPVNAVCSETRGEQLCGQKYWVRYTVTTPAKCGGAGCPADFQLDGPACPPVDCEVSAWTDPSNKPTCGTYTQTRAVTKPAAYGGKACPELTRTVDLGSCAVDCQVSAWVNPSPLPTCGSYTRVRTITQQPQNGGVACPALTEEVQLAPCPVDCLLDEWRDPSPKPTCGTYTRTRAVLRQPANGGLACGATSETVNLGPCPTCSCVYEMSSSLAGTAELDQACSSVCMTKGVRGISSWIKGPNLTMAQCSCMDIPESPCPVDMSTSRYSAPYKNIESFQPARCIPSGLPTPVDCVMGPWVYPNPLPPCGTVIRTRSILVQPANNGAPCGATQEPYYIGVCAPTKVTCFGSKHRRPYLTDDPVFSATCTDSSGVNVNNQLKTLGSFAAGPGRNAPASDVEYDVPFASNPAGDGYEVTTVPAKVKVDKLSSSCSVTPQGITVGTAITEATLGAVGNGSFSYKYKVAGSVDSFATLVVDGTFKPPGGTYSIEATFTPKDTNYDQATCTGSLSVTAAPVATCTCSYSAAPGNPNGASYCKNVCDAVSSPKSQYFSPGYCVCSEMVVKVCPATANGASWNVAATAPPSCKINSTARVATSCSWSNSSAITYGATIPANLFDPTKSGPKLSSDILGTFVFTDSNGAVIDQTKVLPAGTHTLKATFNPSDPAVYDGTSCTTSLAVNPAVLTVSGKNYRRPYGWNNEALTYTFSGFVNGDTAASVVTSDATWGEAPTSASPPKLYTVNLFAPSIRGSNYTVKTVPATIDVYKQKVECTATSLFMKVGEATPKLTHKCPMLMLGDTESIFGDPPLEVQGRTDIQNTANIVYKPGGITHPNYEVTTRDGYLYVTSKDATSCKWEAALTLPYGSKLPPSLFDPSKSGPYETKGIPGKFTFSHSESSPLSVGTTRVTATFEPTDVANYASSECSTDVVVNAAVVECQIQNKSRPYGSANPANTYTCSGLQGTDAITTAGTFKAGPAVDVAPGEYPILFESLPKAGPNYIVKEKPATLTVSQAAARCYADYQEMYVKGKVPSPLTHTCTGLVLGQTKDIFGVPPLRITGDLTIGGNKTISYDPAKPITHPNYLVETAPGILLVKDQEATKCSWNNNTALSLAYGSVVSGDYFDATKLGAKEASGVGGTFTYTHSGGWMPPAGPTTMRATFTPSNPERYLGTTCDLVVNVSQATLQCAPKPIVRVYGESNPPFTYTCTGFVGTDNMSIVSGGTFSVGPDVKAKPDSYPYSLTSNPTAGPNYIVKGGGSTITVDPRPAKCWAEPKSMIVGGTVPPLTHMCSGLPADEDYKVVFGDPKLFVEGSTTTAGFPLIKYPTGGVVHPNYTVTTTNGTLTVTDKTVLTCSWAAAAAITYGTALPAALFDPLQKGPKLSTTGISGQWSFNKNAGDSLNAGTHTITATFKPSSPTYTEAKCDTSIVVNPYPFTCSGKAYERFFGEADPSFDYTCVDAAGADYKAKLTTVGVFNAGPGSTVGPKNFHSIDFATKPAAGSNYIVTTNPAQLNVKPKAVTCEVQSFTREYGVDNPTLTFTCSGFVSPDSIKTVFTTSPTTTATKFSAPNPSYPITLATPPTANYAIQITQGSLTVNAAAVKCEGEKKSRAYNTANPSLGYTCTLTRDNTPLTITGASFKATDFPGLTSKVGPYPINFETKPTNASYLITWAPGEIAVTQANSTCSLAPSQMLAGDTMSYSKLNPSMSPAGVMTYYYASDNTKVSEGVVLQGGTYEIKADLAPTDFTNYKSTSCTGTLSVLTTTSCTAKYSTGLKLGPTTAFNQTFVASGLLASDPTLDGTWTYTINGAPINYTTRPTSKTTVVGTFTPSKAGYAPATCQTTINPVACLTASDCTANDNNDCTDNACNFSGVCYNKYKGASGALSPTVTLTCPNTFRIEFNDVLRCVDPTDSKAKYQIGVQSSGLSGWPTYAAGLLDTSASRAGFNCAGGKCSFQSTSIANTNFVSGKTIYAGVMAFANQAFLNSVPDLYAKEFTSAAATCALCGNNKIETGEECDGTALPAGAPAGSTCTTGCHLNPPPGASCKSLYSTKPGYAAYTEGYGPTSGENATIACQKASDKLTAKLATLNLTGLTVVKDVPDDFYQWNSTLQIDQIGCTATACVYTAPPPPSTSLCGNGVIDAGEQCEGSVDSSCAGMGCTCVGCQYKCPDTAYTGGCYTYVWFEKDYNLACQPGEMTTQTMHTKWGEDLYEIMIPEKTSGTGYISWPVTPSGPGSCCPKQGGTTKKVQVPCGGEANITLSSECTAANSQKEQLTFCHGFSGYENFSIPLTASGYLYGRTWIPTSEKYPICTTAQ